MYFTDANVGILDAPVTSWAPSQAGPPVDVVPGPVWETTIPVVMSSTTAVAFDVVNRDVMLMVSPGAGVIVDELQGDE